MIAENKKPIWVTFDKANRLVKTQQGGETKAYNKSCTIAGAPVSAKYHEEKRDGFTSRQIILTLADGTEQMKIPMGVNPNAPIHDNEDNETFSFWSNVANVLLASIEAKKKGEVLSITPYFGKKYGEFKGISYYELSFNLTTPSELPPFWDKEVAIYTSLAQFLGGELPPKKEKRYTKEPKKKGGYQIPQALQDKVWEWYESLINTLNATAAPETAPPTLLEEADGLPF